MNKIGILLKEYKNINVLEGSSVFFFFCFWSTKLFSLLQQKSGSLNNLVHRLVYFLPKPNFVIQNMSGIFSVQAFDDSTTICSDYFEKELRGWLTSPATKDIFVDIGANRGIYTVIAPTLFGYKEVHAFEPNPEVVDILKKNIELNNLSNLVTVHDYAVGEQKETVNFECDPMHKGGGRIATTGSTNQQINVEAFDIVMQNVPAWRISFIKIDTEGFEFKVLSGMTKTLREMSNQSCLMIESTELGEVTSILSKYNFKHAESKNHDHLFIKNA